MQRLIALVSVLAVLGVLVATPSALAQTSEEFSAMKQRLESLETEVVDLRSRVATQDGQWLNEQRAQQVKELVREVLADADTRAALMDTALTAGWKNGFYMGSEDGNYLLRIRGLLMIRHVYNHQSDPPPAASDEDRSGFELARTRFGFFGNVMDPSWQYALWTGHAANGGVTLLDVYIKKQFDSGFSLTTGQFKVPFWREWLIGEARLPMVERSMLNVFSGSYSQGLMVGYENDNVHLYGAFSDGLNGLNTPFNTEDVEFAVTGRGELLLAGSWGQYAELEGWAGEGFMLVLGAAGHYEQREFGTPATEPEVGRWTMDISLKTDRFSLLAAGIGNYQGRTGQVDQYGALVQAGYFITDDIESHVRWEWGDSDIDGDKDLSVLTVGLDYHMRKHQVRLTFDVGYAFNPVAPFWANGNTLAGYRADSPDDDGQIVVRSQMQLSF
jgi:hypothetical protein